MITRRVESRLTPGNTEACICTVLGTISKLRDLVSPSLNLPFGRKAHWLASMP
jgi:hypothetical protein